MKTPIGGPLRRRRLIDDATQTLREAILDGRLLPGARLRQTDLARQLAISRTPIRDALERLHQEGLVELLPGGGVRVVALDLREAAELYDLREVLDGLAARLAARRSEPAFVGRLRRALARMEECLKGRNFNRWFPAHVAFHAEIYRAAGNQRLLAVASIVRLSIRHFHPLLLKTGHRLGDAYEEHRRIFEAIAGGESETAEREARGHIANAREIVLKLVAEERSDAAVQV